MIRFLFFIVFGIWFTCFNTVQTYGQGDSLRTYSSTNNNNKTNLNSKYLGTVTAAFVSPDSVCTNSTVQITNTSTGASNYYWSFCEASLSSVPDAINLGNPGGLLNGPVFTDLAQDISGNYFVFAVNNYTSQVVRMNFGNSLLNIPSVDNLGSFAGAIPQNAEGIQLVNVGGNWTAIIVGGDPVSGNPSAIAKIDFGASLASLTPVAVNWGNIGGLSYPTDLYVFNVGVNWYGYTVNSRNNTITQFNFGINFTTVPLGINLGNLGNLNMPVGIGEINDAGNWYLFITNNGDGTLTRLSFGNSLLNTPTSQNIGNPGGILNNPRDISFIRFCDGIKGYVVNWTGNSIVELDFGNNLLGNPISISLGNLGNLGFPHSLSKFFRVNNDIYSFITNVNSNTITRMHFAGCNLSGSTLQNPSAITYTQPGVYDINLMVDVGLPTQTSFCKQIVVTDCCPPITGTFTGNSICPGQTGLLTFHPTSTPLNPPFTIFYSDQSNNYIQVNVQDDVAFPVHINPLVTTKYPLQEITDATNCSTMMSSDSATITIIPPINFSITPDTSICLNGAAQLNVSGGQNYAWSPSVYLNNPNISNPVAQITQSTRFYVAGKDLNNCNVLDSVMVNIIQPPVFQAPSPETICKGQSVVLKSANDTKNIYAWTPSSFLNDPNAPQPIATPDQTTTYNLNISDPVCVQYDSSFNVLVTVNDAPVVVASKSNDINCSNLTSHLSASGAESYSWLPGTNLDDPSIDAPIASLTATTQFIVKGTAANGCYAFDSVTVYVTETGQNAFSVPNAFTPNNDGINDCFGIRNWGSVTLQDFSIYNRWGQRVFQTKNPSECWDGTFQGQKQDSGGFVYIIKASSICGNIFRKGNLLLIR
jgi:gliding motility-associated-like protein